MNQANKSRLILLSGPSGAGKSTVVRQLLQQCELPLRLSVSATTRSPRPGETDGEDYYFLTPEKFQSLRAESAFLECKEVFGAGHWYGTLQSEVDQGIADGYWIILEIDVQGALDVLEAEPDAVSIFIHPGGMDELERRLRDRGTETDAAINRRLETAAEEMRYMHRYTYEIINGSVDAAVAHICQILTDHQESQTCSKN